MDTSSINSGQSIGLNTSVVVGGDASIDASARANQVASASGNGNSNASATGSETLVAGSSGNISISGNTTSLRLSALLEGSALAESVNGAASARNGAQNPDFSVDSGNPPPARIVGLGATAPLQLLVNGSLSNGGSISGQSTIATRATSIQGEAIADTAIQSLGSNNNDLRVNGAIGAGPGGSGLLIEAFSAASTRASSVNAGTFSGATPNNVSATTILQNAALLNSQLEAGGSGTIRLQSGITSNTSASAVKSGPLGIDTDPGNNPATPNFNGSTNARDAAGVVSLSSLASVALAPYSTGVNESPVALPPQTDFTPIPATFPASISLPPTDPDTGLVINGPNNSGRLGQSIAGINDFNGDGIDDLAVVAPEANKAYVLYGKSSGFGTGVDFNNLAASDGVTIQNININASFQGGSAQVASAGDLNNDGFADLAIIAEISNATGYIIYGRPTSSSGPIDGSNLGSPDGFRITGIPNTQNFAPKLTITGVGDVSGDGIDDLFVANASSNQVFLIFGTTSQANQVNISSGLGSSGINIVNSNSGVFSNTSLGRAATGLGDINGDGIDDFAVSDPTLQGFGGTPGDGRVYVIYGGSFSTTGTTPITLSTSNSISTASQISGASGFAVGGVANEGLGRYLAAGDVNGDNKPDLVINNTSGAGKDYAVFGRSSNDAPFTDITTNQIQAPDGLIIEGTSGSTGIAGRLSGPISIGDVNGDQIGDIIQNSPFASPKEVAVVFGQRQNTTTTITIASALDGTNGFRLTDNGFSTVSSGNADVNNDGAADILLGDSFSSSNGKIGIVFGNNPTLPPPPALTATNSVPLKVGQAGQLQLSSTITSSGTATNTTGSALAIDNSSSIGAALLNDGSGTITNLLIGASGNIQVSSSSNSQIASNSNLGDAEAIGNLISSGILNITPAAAGTFNSGLPSLNISGSNAVINNETNAISMVSSRTVSGNAIATTGSVYGAGPTAQSPTNALSPLGAAILGIRDVAINAGSASGGNVSVLKSSAQGILATSAQTIRGDAVASNISTAGALTGTGASTIETNGGLNAIASLTNRVIAQSVSGNSSSSSFANSSGVDGYQITIAGSGGINAQSATESAASAI